MIVGVHLRPLRVLEDPRGYVKRFMRLDDIWFQGFGEVYFSMCKANAVKAWHLHKRMTLNYAVVFGRAMVGLYDARPTSMTKGQVARLELASLGDDYQCLTIPPGVWNGYRSAIPGHEVIIANCATEPHLSDEIERMRPEDFPLPFDWGAYDVGG